MIVPNSHRRRTLALRGAAVRDPGDRASRRFLTVLAVFRRTPRQKTLSLLRVSESTGEHRLKTAKTVKTVGARLMTRDRSRALPAMRWDFSGMGCVSRDSGTARLRYRWHRHFVGPTPGGLCGTTGTRVRR